VWDLLTDTHTRLTAPLSRTTRVSRYQKGKTSLDFTEARDSEWQWHQLGHMQVCTLLQIDNHTSTPPLCFLQAGCPPCHPTNSVKALKANTSLQTVGPKFTRYARRAAAVIDQYLLPASDLSRRAAGPPLLPSINGTDRRTNGHPTVT